MLLEIIFAFIGTICFCVLFNVSRKHCVFCGLIGAFTWFIYSLTLHITNYQYLATFISCFALTLMARFFSVKRKAPATIFLLTGIFVLVPGAGMYYTTYNAFLNNAQEALVHFDVTIKVALLISLGIVFGYILPPKLFGWNNKEYVK
ncbi:MAG: threonine/serine exporter family protein [Oscillospiraceae bacterium]